MYIQERLKMILKMHNLSAASFADKIGVQRSNISHVLSGRSKPGLDFLEKIITQFPRVNAHWLLTGHMPSSVDNSIERKAQDVLSAQKELDSNQNEIEKIVVFYKDGGFKTYTPKNG